MRRHHSQYQRNLSERCLISQSLNHQRPSDQLPGVRTIVCRVLPTDWAPCWVLCTFHLEPSEWPSEVVITTHTSHMRKQRSERLGDFTCTSQTARAWGEVGPRSVGLQSLTSFYNNVLPQLSLSQVQKCHLSHTCSQRSFSFTPLLREGHQSPFQSV